MGLFETQNIQEIENEIMHKMSTLPILNCIVGILQDAKDWMTKSQGYYDNCKRTVTIEPDLFQIKWSEMVYEEYEDSSGKKRTKEVERVYESACLKYTEYGYIPLHRFCNDRGKEIITSGRSCFLWATVVRARMISEMPNCKFGNIRGSDKSAQFVFTVAPLMFRDWI